MSDTTPKRNLAVVKPKTTPTPPENTDPVEPAPPLDAADVSEGNPNDRGQINVAVEELTRMMVMQQGQMREQVESMRRMRQEMQQQLTNATIARDAVNKQPATRGPSRPTSVGLSGKSRPSQIPPFAYTAEECVDLVDATLNHTEDEDGLQTLTITVRGRWHPTSTPDLERFVSLSQRTRSGRWVGRDAGIHDGKRYQLQLSLDRWGNARPPAFLNPFEIEHISGASAATDQGA